MHTRIRSDERSVAEINGPRIGPRDLTHLSGATGLFAKLPLDLLGVELEDLANIIAPLKKPEREDAKTSSRDMRWCAHTHKK